MTAAPATSEQHLLQSVVWPDPELCSERDLFVRLNGPAGQSMTTGRITFKEGSFVQFDTYFNFFPIGKWQYHCGLDQIGLTLSGDGEIELRVFMVFPDRSWGRLVNEVVYLKSGDPQHFDIPLTGQPDNRGLLFFEFQSMSDGHLEQAAWVTEMPARREPKLAVSVTTFLREDAVAKVVERFERFAAGSPLADQLHMLIVDNGRSAKIPHSDKVTLVENENLGGAGGFARGLIEARKRGFTHCLFMDDDANTPMDAIERTWRFLAYATDEASAVAGAMISTRHAWAIWENGAIFDGMCRPLFGGTDLRDRKQVVHMECASIQRQPSNFYGGWWFFAFPLAQVTHMPFPFFVRGDDVSFSLAHDFNTVTLPGVVSFQESFTEKDTTLTWYLDLRSHLAHLLSLPAMDIGKTATVKVALWFWARTFLTCHYETMAAVSQAIEDVLAGPEYFAKHADVAERRAQLADARQVEIWRPCPTPPPEKRRFNSGRIWTRAFMRITLNGLLIPFFSHIGNKITLTPDSRWAIRPHWGAAETTYYDRGAAMAYTVRHDKLRALKESARAGRAIWKLWLEYETLKTAWQRAYPELTGQDFWQSALMLNKASTKTRAAAE